MARFSSFIFTDRGTEVHRLGHSSIRSVSYSHHISIHTNFNRFGEGTKRDPYTERCDIWLDRGYGDHSNKYVPLCSIAENGVISMPDNILELVKEHNARIEGA